MGHIYLEIIQVISAYCCRRNFNLFYLQVVDKVGNTLGSRLAELQSEVIHYEDLRSWKGNDIIYPDGRDKNSNISSLCPAGFTFL